MPASMTTDAHKASYLTRYGGMGTDVARMVDSKIRIMLDRLDLYHETSLILGYLPVREEVDTVPIMREILLSGKQLALPYLDTRQSRLNFYLVDTLAGLSRGSRGLAQPPLDAKAPLTFLDLAGSLCLVPGVVFDHEGYRVGYGAGYYDEFLAFYPGNKVGLVRSMQISTSALPHDGHDIAVDVLVSEGSIWRCRRL